MEWMSGNLRKYLYQSTVCHCFIIDTACFYSSGSTQSNAIIFHWSNREVKPWAKIKQLVSRSGSWTQFPYSQVQNSFYPTTSSLFANVWSSLTPQVYVQPTLRPGGPWWQRKGGLKKMNVIFLKPQKNYQLVYALQETNVSWAFPICFDRGQLIKYYFLPQLLMCWGFHRCLALLVN